MNGRGGTEREQGHGLKDYYKKTERKTKPELMKKRKRMRKAKEQKDK